MVEISQARSYVTSSPSKQNGYPQYAYSTGCNPESRATMFDAFCKTMLDDNNVKRMHKAAEPQFNASKEELQELADKIILNSGADASATARIKRGDSFQKKVKKNLKEIWKDGYDKARARVLDLIVNDGPVSLVNDGYGIRLTINKKMTGNHKTADLLFNELRKCHGNPDFDLILTEIEDYHGRGINPYAGENNVKLFEDLEYTTPSGRKGNVSTKERLKPNGYTRTNSCGYIKGKPGEIQIGGLLTNKWGDVEHILYDAREGKALDLSHFKTQEQKDLAVEIRTAYEKVLENPKLSKEYSDNYLNPMWYILCEAEDKNLDTPNYPVLPDGIPEILSAESLMKLADS